MDYRVSTVILYVRFVWMALIVAFSSVTGYQIHTQVTRFWNKPVATNLDVRYPGRLPFPAVTVCNANAARFDTLFPRT